MPSLYVHVPFCLRKCHYCAFYSQPLMGLHSSAQPADYLEGLELEILERHKDAPQGVSSLFIGGGTPTVLELEQLERLLQLIRSYFPMSAEAEKTMEGNPGTLTPEKLELIRRYGINRFSLGVQSLDDDVLKAAGRIHNAGQIREAVALLRTAGFANINLDLMFGLPRQTMPVWQSTLEEVLTYAPEHLSLYGLMLEEGTLLYEQYRGGEKNSLGRKAGPEPDGLPDDDLQAEMYDWAAERLVREGYRRYETSNFARPGYECQHNLGYWRGTDYLGLGPGGVSCLNRVRWKNVEDINIYKESLLKKENPLSEDGAETLSLRDCMAERMILGLRLAEGVSLTAFKKDFGADLRDIYREVLERYKNENVFRFQGDYLCLNPQYSFTANFVLQEFVDGPG